MKTLTIPAGPACRDINEARYLGEKERADNLQKDRDQLQIANLALALQVQQHMEHVNRMTAGYTRIAQERDAAKQQVQTAVTIIQECRECLFGELDATDDLKEAVDVFVKGNNCG